MQRTRMYTAEQRVELRLCAARPQRRDALRGIRAKTQNSLIARGLLHVLRGADAGEPRYEYVVTTTKKGDRLLSGIKRWQSLKIQSEEHLVAQLEAARAELLSLAAEYECAGCDEPHCAHCRSKQALEALEAHQKTFCEWAQNARNYEKMAKQGASGYREKKT